MVNSIQLPFLLLVFGLSVVHSARILAVLPLPVTSHHLYSQSVLAALAARGHHITIYSPYPPAPTLNVTHIEIHTPHEEHMKNMLTFKSFEEFFQKSSYFGFGFGVVWKFSYNICEGTLNHEKIKSLLASKKKFDLVISEYLFGEESMLVFGHYFNVPTVNLNSFGLSSIMNRVHGNDLQIAISPDPVSFSFTCRMSFLERLRNFVSIAVTMYHYYSTHLPNHDAIINHAFKDRSIPPVEEMVSNISLTMANIHPIVSYPQMYPSSIVPVGGIHIEKDPAPLPKVLRTFMEDTDVIYFSLGTVVPVHLMPQKYLQIFTNVFRKLPYKVIWKIKADSIPDLPDNVMISKWVPQQSVLAHPNCALFITHGGLLSQHEAFHAGVPVVGIPFFGDQPFNVRLYENLGTGVGLDFHSLTEQSMMEAVSTVMRNASFSENARRISSIYRNRPIDPADSVVFWVENVLRNRHARYLRPRAAELPWYQLAQLDVMVVLSLALVVIMKLSYLYFQYVIEKVKIRLRKIKETLSGKKKRY